MNEQRLVTLAIRLFGLWRIASYGGNAFYYVIAKDIGVPLRSEYPVSADLLSLIYEVAFGMALIVAAPFISRMIYPSQIKLEKPAP